MEESKLLSNRRIEKLNSKTDYLGIINKGDLIKQFLKGSTSSIDEIKMFALYGEWGSGKSTLMKYLQDELSGDFNTFFFEAWEYEKDENLAMSLLEYITFESKTPSEEFYQDVLKYGGRILRGMGKSIKLNIPLFTNGPGIELNPAAFVEEMTKSEEISFYEALKKFKLEFNRLEDYITKGNNHKYNIVFIDDLDRCEPEQVLNLMSAIKLFFTYGNKTIFFCGIDKSAVEAAVKTKYGKVVKANEYLEKIFDVTFSMPNEIMIQKLIDYYFDDTSYNLKYHNHSIRYLVNDFFKYLEFYNPRRIKKVLNKFQMMRNFKKMDKELDNPFPNIDLRNNSEKSLFETFLVLYLLILHEFYSADFDNFINFELKRKVYLNTIDDLRGASDSFNNLIEENFSDIPFLKIATYAESNPNQSMFSICISPIKIERNSFKSFYIGFTNDIISSKKDIDFLFYKYVNKYSFKYWTESKSSSATFKSIKKLIKDLL